MTSGCYDLLKQHERLYAIGPFAKVRKVEVKEAIKTETLRCSGPTDLPSAVAMLKNYRSVAKITDFTGDVRCMVPKGIPVVERLAYRSGEEGLALLDAIKGNHPCLLFWTWTEHPLDRSLRVPD